MNRRKFVQDNDKTSNDLSTSSTSTTKTNELIQRILESLKSKTPRSSFCSSTTDNRIYLQFTDENELGARPQADDLLEKLQSNTKQCSCHRIDIRLENVRLNETFSYKEKQKLLRILLRRQQIYERYFSSR